VKSLSPSQQQAFDALVTAYSKGNIFVVSSNDGRGRTTILKEFQKRHGGYWLPMKDYIDELRGKHPLQMEETLESFWLQSSVEMFSTTQKWKPQLLMGCGKSHETLP